MGNDSRPCSTRCRAETAPEWRPHSGNSHPKFDTIRFILEKIENSDNIRENLKQILQEKLYFCIEKEKEDEPGFRQSYYRVVVISKDKNEYDQQRANYHDRDYDD